MVFNSIRSFRCLPSSLFVFVSLASCIKKTPEQAGVKNGATIETPSGIYMVWAEPISMGGNSAIGLCFYGGLYDKNDKKNKLSVGDWNNGKNKIDLKSLNESHNSAGRPELNQEQFEDAAMEDSFVNNVVANAGNFMHPILSKKTVPVNAAAFLAAMSKNIEDTTNNLNAQQEYLLKRYNPVEYKKKIIVNPRTEQEAKDMNAAGVAGTLAGTAGSIASFATMIAGIAAPVPAAIMFGPVGVATSLVIGGYAAYSMGAKDSPASASSLATAAAVVPFVFVNTIDSKVEWAGYNFRARKDQKSLAVLPILSEVIKLGENGKVVDFKTEKIISELSSTVAANAAGQKPGVKKIDVAEIKSSFERFYDSFIISFESRKLSKQFAKPLDTLAFVNKPNSEVFTSEAMKAAYYDEMECQTEVSEVSTPMLWSKIQSAQGN